MYIFFSFAICYGFQRSLTGLQQFSSMEYKAPVFALSKNIKSHKGCFFLFVFYHEQTSVCNAQWLTELFIHNIIKGINLI